MGLTKTIEADTLAECLTIFASFVSFNTEQGVASLDGFPTSQLVSATVGSKQPDGRWQMLGSGGVEEAMGMMGRKEPETKFVIFVRWD